MLRRRTRQRGARRCAPRRPTLEPETDPCAHPSGSSAAVRCRRCRSCALLLLAALALAACDTAEERAEQHYQRGMALLQEGDVDRAMIEFRNVFRLNGEHLPARANMPACSPSAASCARR